jgi:hypothetical protein
VGGGTLRDLMLDRNPVFWIADPTPIAIACGVALVVFFTAHLLESRLKVLIWLDALALPDRCGRRCPPPRPRWERRPCRPRHGRGDRLTFGGLMRDVVANEVPLLSSNRVSFMSRPRWQAGRRRDRGAARLLPSRGARIACVATRSRCGPDRWPSAGVCRSTNHAPRATNPSRRSPSRGPAA